MKLSTGKKAFLVEFDNGDAQTIYFNPNDPDLMIRLKNFESRVSEKINKFEDVELTQEGEPSQTAQIEIFEKMQNILKEELDFAFGGDVSQVVFRHCSPFAIIDGEYFVIQFVKAVAPEIERLIKEENEKMEQKADKYLNKYQK